MSRIKIISIVGVRPQIIKSSAVSRVIQNLYHDKIQEVVIHTGQHYDKELSDVFFNELKIKKPKYNLKVGSAKGGRQTALSIAGIENVLIEEKPDCIIVYGDTNSTLAGAIAASKLHFPIVHIDAGVRSFNKQTSEEINRILTDHVSTLLFAPTDTAFKNLMREGFRPENAPPYHINNPKIFLTGDIMYDNSLFFSSLAEEKTASILKNLNIEKNNFILSTIHREKNTDDIIRLRSIFTTLIDIASENKIVIVLPLHPRTALSLKTNLKSLYDKLADNEFVRVMPPVSYLTMTCFIKNCRLVITDSIGLQKEAHFLKKPSLILRRETEWTELVKNGTAKLVDADSKAIREGFTYFMKNTEDLYFPTFYGNGKAAEFILSEIMMMFEKS